MNTFLLKINHSSGELVEKLQRSLGVEITGFFDGLTETAVKEYQKKHGMYPSGMVDEILWEEICEDNN